MGQGGGGEDVEGLALLQALAQAARGAPFRREAAAIVPAEIGKDAVKASFRLPAAITLMSAADADDVRAIISATSQARIASRPFPMRADNTAGAQFARSDFRIIAGATSASPSSFCCWRGIEKQTEKPSVVRRVTMPWVGSEDCSTTQDANG